MQRILIIILSVLFLVQQPTYAQNEDLSFYTLNDKDGLNHNLIFSFLKDSRGILWIGTINGLDRFDGSHFYSFKMKRDSNSIPNAGINSLCEDKKGNIWGATSNGVFCYLSAENRFIIYYAPVNCYYNYFSNILCDEQGSIWATTTNELLKFNAGADSFIKKAQFSTPDSAAHYAVRNNGLLRDAVSNGLWIATRSGLRFYNGNRDKLEGYLDHPGHPLFAKKSVAALARSHNGNFWYFDNNTKEIVAFNPTTQTIRRKISIGKEMPAAVGATIFEDKEQRLWFSSWSYELITVDLKTNTIEKLKNRENDSHSVAGDFFWAAMEDENGTVWLGTSGGISMCNPGKNSYKAFHLPGKIPQLSATNITIIEEDPLDKSWWIVADNALIVHYFPATAKYQVFDLRKSIPTKTGVLPGGIYFLRFIEDQVVALSTTGAWQLKRGSAAFVPFNLMPPPFSSWVIRNMISRGDSVFYFTDGLQMVAWNNKTRQAEWIRYEDTRSKETTPTGFGHLVLKPGYPLWWVTSGYFIASLQENNRPMPVNMIKNKGLETGSYFSSMDVDQEGNVWVCNAGVGLYRYDPGSKEVRYWNKMDGLVDNSILKIKVDDKDHVWAIGFNKVSVFDPATNKFSNFKVPFSENKLNYENWIMKRADGVITASISNDIFEFYDDKLNYTPQKIMPRISLINVSGKDHLITTDNKLVLNPDENSLRIKFGILIDPSFFSHEFEYLLEGSDKTWVSSSSGNEAVYNNLPPGKYRFHLVARGKNNAWQSAELIFVISIKTPFYKTWWFLTACILLFTYILFAIYRYRISNKEKLMQLESKAQLLEKEKVMVMYESLKQQLNPHFLFNSLTSLSGLIATNQDLAGEFLEQMSGIYRYILKNGDHETVTLHDEIEFVKLYINLQQTRFKKGLAVNIDVPDDNLHYKIAPVTLQNLIENAIKHNIIDAESPLVIDIFTENDYLVVQNNLQKKNMVETSNKKGLAQFATLYKYLSEKPIVIEESTQRFIIKIPLI